MWALGDNWLPRVTLPLRADQGLFLTMFLMFLVTMSTRALIVGVYSVYSVFTLSLPNLSLAMNTLGIWF